MSYRKTYTGITLDMEHNNVIPTDGGLAAYINNSGGDDQDPDLPYGMVDYYDEKKRPNLPIEPVVTNMMLSAFMVISCICDSTGTMEPCPREGAIMVRFMCSEECITRFETMLRAMGVGFTAEEGG